jgi:VWFA-related protein
MRQAFGRRWIGAILFALLAFSTFEISIGAHPAAAQAQQTPTKPLQYEVTVVLKLIHVYVTDKKGQPVPDLAINDFAITDNGQPVTVTDFEKRVLRAAAAAPQAAEPVESAAEKVAPNPPAARDTNRKFFLFIDFAYNNARGVTKAKKAALHFLDNDVAPEDEVALLSYSMIKGMSVHEYLTTDHSKVRKALETVGQKDIVGRADEVEEQYWQQATEGLRDMDNSRGAAIPGSKEIAETNIRRWESKQIAQTFLLSMTALAKALRMVPGQKHFIFFSSGIPGSLLYGNQAGTPSAYNPNKPTFQGSLFETGDTVLRSQAEEANKEFGASGCAFYIFDTRESAMKTSMFERDSQTLETGNRTNFSPTSAFEVNSMFKSDKITGLTPLNQLADKTGGRYFSNIDIYEKNLDLVQAMTGTYYVLGYPVSEQWDGKFHEVKVEVKRKGCEVRAQAGYFNPKPFSEYTDLEKQIHLFDLALNERAFSRMLIDIPMTALSSSAEGITRLAVLAVIPGKITAKFSDKRVEFVAIFFDEKGDISNVVREEADPASLRGRDLAFAAGAVLKPGDYSCRLVIRDMDTGQSAVASAKATVIKPQMTGIQLGTPLLLEARAGCSFLSASSKKARGAFPWTEIYPYDGTQLAPVLAGLAASTESIQVVIPCSVAGGGRPELALSANLINAASGSRSPLTILRLDRAQKGPLEILTLEIQTAGTAPGTYYLHFYAQDRISNALGHTFTTLSVAGR